MSSRVTEAVPYDIPMYMGTDMSQRWKGYFLSLDRATNGFQQAPSTVSGPSPYILRNGTACDQMVFVSGGGGLTIEYSRDSASWTPTGITSGQFMVFPGDYLRITYTTAPTINVVTR